MRRQAVRCNLKIGQVPPWLDAAAETYPVAGHLNHIGWKARHFALR